MYHTIQGTWITWQKKPHGYVCQGVTSRPPSPTVRSHVGRYLVLEFPSLRKRCAAVFSSQYETAFSDTVFQSITCVPNASPSTSSNAIASHTQDRHVQPSLSGLGGTARMMLSVQSKSRILAIVTRMRSMLVAVMVISRSSKLHCEVLPVCMRSCTCSQVPRDFLFSSLGPIIRAQ